MRQHWENLMYKPIKHLLSATVVLLSLSSCASLFTSSTQDVDLKGIPGTKIVDSKKNRIVGQIGKNGFLTISVRKSLKSKHYEASREGYLTNNFELGTKIQPWFWGNFIFGGIPGMGIDVATGKMMKYSTNLLDVTLIPDPNYEPEEETEVTAPLGPADRVTRTNPGATEQEKNIIRWYIDSDPRGARIFYRVISNNPSEVKNTNETYLTTTPIEETRSFNILGLTYDNAHDVTIEIKVTKRGYEDQVKRYNVRQALDQQEISGFFELVPKSN